MYYHASPVRDIAVLEPRISNHGKPLVYLSQKRENVLVYLCNAIERYCKETGFAHEGIWQKWAAYGFDPDGIQRIEEYYPDALKKTYQGVSGYIYSAEAVITPDFDPRIPDAVATGEQVKVTGVEFVADAYLAILEAAEKGLVRIRRYEDSTPKQLEWIRTTIRKEYEEAAAHPEYRHFLKGNFPHILG